MFELRGTTVCSANTERRREQVGMSVACVPEIILLEVVVRSNSELVLGSAPPRTVQSICPEKILQAATLRSVANPPLVRPSGQTGSTGAKLKYAI